MRHLIIIFLFVCVVAVCAFGPKKLYSLTLPAEIVSVKVVGRQIFFVGPWYIAVVDNVQWKFQQKARMNPRIINKDIPNPRMIGKIPTGTFKGSRETTFWVTTWGTNDTAGAVYVLKQTTDYSEWGDISIDAGWNYERTQWVDMNRDGYKDCLTARFRGGVGQILWFQQPPGQTLWGQRIIHEGMADGNFVGFIYDKKSYILVAGNQFSSLGLYWTMNRVNNWAFSRQVRHRVIDNYGRYYDVQYVDLNKDGRPDVLTTTVQISSSRGQVLGYEIPFDIQNKIWPRRVLAAGFTGDYSPGKAMAYWPNKWKRKSDRPSIFLSGAGEEKLFILSPKPKNSGWGYVKSSLTAGVGMIGIPYIADLNSDSYPEVFVPQGNQVHVFSYDYGTSAASAPRSNPTVRRTTTTRPSVPFRNPFFRPTAPSLPPAIPADADPVGPLSDNTGPSRDAPVRTNILGSGPSGSSGGQPRYPSDTSAGDNAIAPRPNAASPVQSGGSNLAPQPPRSPAQPPQQQPVVPAIPYNPNPVLGSDGRYYQPVGPQNQVIFPWYQNQNTPALQSTNLPATTTPGSTSDVPFDSDYQGWDVAFDPGNLGYPSEEEANEPFDPMELTPPNLVLSVTEELFSYHSEAADACSMSRQVLCNLEQLQRAVDVGGPIPDFEWGWYIDEQRAATLEECIPGEVKYEGYICHNGVVAHLPILNEASLPALCCSVVNWATVTKRRFSRQEDAENQCKKSERHLCSLSEMKRVWDESSYKGFQWGWFDSNNKMVRMAHYCDTQHQPWPGYQCVDNILEITDIKSFPQEIAFCCPSSSVTTSVPFRNPFFRPTAPSLPPAIPADADPVGPLSDNTGPSRDAPVRTNILGSGPSGSSGGCPSSSVTIQTSALMVLLCAIFAFFLH